MATSSTVAAFKTALVTALTTAINDSTVQVEYGEPQDSLKRREGVYVAGVSYSAEVANIKADRKQYNEDYSVDVLFHVARARGLASEAESRVFELFEYLRDWVAENATGGSVDGVWSVTLTSVEADVAHEGEAPVAVLAATVRVQARVE